MKTRSISLRLTIWFSVIFLGGFALFGAAMWFDLAYSLARGRDRTLHRRATRAVETIEAARNDEQVRQTRLTQFADGTPEGNLIHIYDSAGRRLFPRTPSPSDFPWPPLELTSREELSKRWYRGHLYRILEYPVPSQPLWIVVAGQLDDNRNMMARFTVGLIWTTPVMLMLSAFGGYLVSRRALYPVDRITTALHSINIGSLSRRLPVTSTGDELQRLAETCNDMLARLEDAVIRINRFTADASHELRSPMALIRTVAEYALRKPGIDCEIREAFEEILAEAMEAAALLEDMLTLARADAGYANQMFEPVELVEVVRDACARVLPLAAAKGQAVHADLGNAPVWVSGDRSSLRRLTSILLDNAVKYTQKGGEIGLDLVSKDSCALLTVRDNGMGIPDTVLPQIFDRFVRADPSRGEVHGTGLGLAIAKSIASAHRAALRAESIEGAGSAFTVEFRTGRPAPPES